MSFAPCVKELQEGWFPHTTDSGLKRLIGLLESGSPLLVHGAFTKSLPMGCLATHIAWHHPVTNKMTHDAGVIWLSHIAGMNPATSVVIRAWDDGGQTNWDLRNVILDACREEWNDRMDLDRELASENSETQSMSA
ncbi:hypothetical protein [Zavarzinella formosa]|uniref:hypothetical protein n=1 Tax=Zavarzinella formosa TaxID=360055 RepID=UPI00037E28A7|nr:hypothetical protein [Zavarzinella formosa]